MKRKTPWKTILMRMLDGFLNLVLAVSGLIALWLVLQVFVFSSYYIPTSSMMPVLVPGDYVLVSKLAYGARLFDLNDAGAGKPFPIHRTWGYSEVRRNDIVVFNNPYPNTRKRMEFDILKYYVKRCIALPGDSLEIRQGHYRVRGVDTPLGNVHNQDSLWSIFSVGEKKIRGVSINAYPKRREFRWNILSFGPLYIPRKGDVLPMDVRHYWLYRLPIEWETQQKLTLMDDGTVWLGERKLKEYRFEHSYYFMGGDNVVNSVDGRYWGLVPDDYLAGRVSLIWKSKDRDTDELRWERMGLVK